MYIRYTTIPMQLSTTTALILKLVIAVIVHHQHKYIIYKGNVTKDFYFLFHQKNLNIRGPNFCNFFSSETVPLIGI